jgi:hypothetical protein
MLIALDYDHTYTADKELWNKFILDAKMRGHKVVCFTMRFDNVEERLYAMPVDVYYTERKAKKVWAEAKGFLVDIWIDDKPAWLFEDAS